MSSSSTTSTSATSSSNFRRGHSKVFYESHWEHGNSSSNNSNSNSNVKADVDLDLEARTSFRSVRSQSNKAGNNSNSDSSDEDSLDLNMRSCPVLLPSSQQQQQQQRGLNRSGELDDILEEEDNLTDSDDHEHESHLSSSASPINDSSSGASHSPDCSFRLGQSASRLSRRSHDSDDSGKNKNVADKSSNVTPPMQTTNASRGAVLAPSLSHKSHDSGFSDSAESNHGGEIMSCSASSSSSASCSSASPTGVPRLPEQSKNNKKEQQVKVNNDDREEEEEEEEERPEVHSEVVHETR